MRTRSLIAEAIGTALLVFFGAGTATLAFGFKTAGSSISAGVVATALAFGLVLLALVYAFGPVSGCHINPAVTIGFLVGRRITLADAIGYWAAQFAGAIAGAAVLYGTVNPARSLGPVLFVGGTALSQLWLFIVAPLVGGALSAFLFEFLYPRGEEEASVAPAREEQTQPVTKPHRV